MSVSQEQELAIIIRYGMISAIKSFLDKNSLDLNAPIVPLFCLERPGGDYLIYALPPFKVVASRGAGHDHILETTRKIAAVFQQEIEKHPDQWMWMYKRWKHIKPGMPAEAYPFYAKPLA